MKIQKLKIENFKRFENLEIELQSLDCLTGSNNSGKSTLLQALVLFDFCLHECLSQKSSNGNGNGAHPIEIKNRTVAPEDFVVLPVTQPADFWFDKQTMKANKHIVIRIAVFFDNGKKVVAAIELNFNRYSLSIQTEQEQDWLKELAKFKISYLPVFSTFSAREERRTPVIITDALATGKINSVIRNILLNLEIGGKTPLLEKIMHRSFPGMKNLNIAFDELTDRYIEATYKEEGQKKEFDIFSAGSGFQQFLYLFGFILLKDPNLILLDEPDVHLHGALQKSLYGELKNLVEEGKQVLFATHSKDLITSVEPNRILHLSDDIPRRLEVNYDIFDTLETLGSIDNIQLSQIQSFRRLLVVENESDWRLIQIFGKKMLGEPVWITVEKRLSLCFAYGNPYKQKIVKLKDQISSLLSLAGSPLKVFVVADNDFYPDRPALLKKKQAENTHIEWHIWERTEIENYLLEINVIRRKSGLNSTPLWDSSFLLEFQQIVENTKEEALKKLMNAIKEFEPEARNWEPSRILDEAQKRLNELWKSEGKLELCDAKEFVLPKIKGWLQANGFNSFSNLGLAEEFMKEEIPTEFQDLVLKIQRFSGVRSS